ncbi:MAG: hypothetical protein WC547_07285 [Candidatus Omnitrophota bacterium]
MSARNRVSMCAVIIAMFFCNVSSSWSQEANTEPQWLWGEVEAVNVQAKTVQVKYLDYDMDIEKELVITVDDKTKFENAKGLEDIKVEDTVSVDYLSDSGGVNLAMTVSVEKLEDMEDVPADMQEPELERVGSDPEENVAAPSEVQAEPVDVQQ